MGLIFNNEEWWCMLISGSMKKNNNTHIFPSSCDVVNNYYYFLMRFYFSFRASISLVLLVISTELSQLKSMNVRLWCMTTFLDNKTSNLCNDMAFDEAIDVEDSFLGWAVLCGMRSFPHLFLRVDNKTNWKKHVKSSFGHVFLTQNVLKSTKGHDFSSKVHLPCE